MRSGLFTLGNLRAAAGFLAALLAGVGIEASTDDNHHRLVTYVAWYGASVALIALVAVVTVVIERRKQDAPALVPDQHSAELRKVVADAVRELQHPRPLILPSDSPFAGGDRLASAFGAHFPALSTLLTEYMNHDQRLQDAERALTGRVTRECEARDIVDPPYDVLQVHATLRPILHSIAKDRRNVATFRFGWEAWPDPPPPVAGLQTTATVRAADSDQALATLPATPAEDLRVRAEAITGRIDQLFSDAQTWDELRDIRAAYDELVGLRPSALARARLDATQELIHAAKGCPTCALNRGREA